MSARIYKIIPTDPFCRIPVQLLEQCAVFAETKLSCASVSFRCSAAPEFVDCGGSLESIFCPVCHSEISFTWWGEAMKSSGKNAFTALHIESPCCGKSISLDELEYHFPCGFSCCEIDILDPDDDIDDGIVDSLQSILGVKLRIITAHI